MGIHRFVSLEAVNKTAKVVTNQKGCDDPITELLIAHRKATETIQEINIKLNQTGLPVATRKKLIATRTRLQREKKELDKKVDEIGLREDVELAKGCKTRRDVFFKVAEKMLSQEVFEAIRARSNKAWNNLKRKPN